MEWIVLEGQQLPQHGTIRGGGTRVTDALQNSLPNACIVTLEPRIHTRADALYNLMLQYWHSPLPQHKNILSLKPVAIKDAWYYLHYPPSPKIELKVMWEEAAACIDLDLPTRGLGTLKRQCRGMIHHWIMRSMVRAAKGFMINSEWGAREMSQWGATAKTTVVYPPCNLDCAGKTGRKIDVITIGSIVPIKRHHTAIEICARSKLAKTVEIIGMTKDGRINQLYLQKLSELADRPGVTLHTNMAENEKYTHMQNAKCVVATCKIEPFGIAIVEAISRGCIPVVFDGYGFRETVPYSELRFSNPDEAVKLVDDVLSGKFDYLLPKLQKHVKQFEPDKFQERVRRCLLTS